MNDNDCLHTGGEKMLKLTFMMLLGFVMVLFSFMYVNGKDNDKK